MSYGKHKAILLILLLENMGCAPNSSPTLFVPPTAGSADFSVPLTRNAAEPTTTLSASASTIIPMIVLPTPTPPCTNILTLLADVTVPDGTTVTAGQSIDKQWLVSNTGSCNWDGRYRLKRMGGDAMGTPTALALYPARAGTQATLRIVFTAPQAEGTYRSDWQAVAPDGSSFGEPIYLNIAVQ